MLYLFCLLALFFTLPSFSNAATEVRQSGTSKGYVNVLDFVGPTVTASGIVGTITVSSGSGTINSGTANQVGYYATTGTAISGNSNFVFNGTNVGIGTSTPTTTFQVLGNVSVGASNASSDTLQSNSTSGGVTSNGIPIGIGGIDSNTKFYTVLNALAFTDISSSARTITNTSITADATTSVLSQAASALSDGTAGHKLSVPASSDWNISSGAWTWDGWWKPSVSFHRGAIVGRMNAGATSGWALYWDTGGKFRWIPDITTNTGSILSPAQTAGQWYYWCVQSDGSTTTMYLGQAGGATSSQGTTSTTPVNDNDVLTMFDDLSGDPTAGNMQSVRYSSGVARCPASSPTGIYTNATTTPTMTLANSGSAQWSVAGNSSTSAATFTNNGHAYQTIDSAGNVGINSASPGKVLDINGAARITSTNSLFLGSDNSVFINSSAATSGDNSFNTGSAERMRITTAGNVGISTVGPQALFQVGNTALGVTSGNVGVGTYAPSPSGLDPTANKVLRVGGATVPVIVMASTNSAQQVEMVHDGSTFGIKVAGHATATNNAIAFFTGNTNSSYTTAERMRIDSAGNVGIGISSGITAPIEVSAAYGAGDKITSEFFNTNGNGYMDVGSSASVSHAINFGYDDTNNYGTFKVNGDSAGTGVVVDDGGNVGINTTVAGSSLSVSGGVAIGSTYATQAAPLGGIIASGNVGIGTSSPGSQLDVSGTVRALSAGTCTTLYKCVGGVDAGVIQTSICGLCPGGSCTAMNGCF